MHFLQTSTDCGPWNTPQGGRQHPVLNRSAVQVQVKEVIMTALCDLDRAINTEFLSGNDCRDYFGGADP